MAYINGLPELHLAYVHHYLKKKDNDYWDRLGSHLGTLWQRADLERLTQPASAEPRELSSRIFAPLSLIINSDLPNALLGKKKGQPQPASGTQGHGLNTAMPLPKGEEIVNMADLSKENFLGVIAGARLSSSAKIEV